MFDFRMSIPTEIVFGKGEVRNVGTLMKRQADNIIMLYGSERIFRCGTGDTIVSELKEAGCEVTLYGGVPANSDSQFVDKAIKTARENKINGILAVGGGSVIDTAKAISAGFSAEGDIMDVFSTLRTGSEVLPIGVVVTVPATGSEANEVAVISEHETHRKIMAPLPQCKPKFAILDPELTLSVPPHQTAVGGFDIFSHAFERYFDLRRQSRLLDEMTLALMRTVADCLPELVKDPENIDLRSEIMFAATVAHSDMLGPGGDFGCHGLSHVVTEVYGTSHGGALAMLVPAWCGVMYHHEPGRFESFFEGVFGTGDVTEGFKKLEAFVESIGLPLDMGGELDPEMMTELTMKTGGQIGSGFRIMTEEEIHSVYEKIK